MLKSFLSPTLFRTNKPNKTAQRCAVLASGDSSLFLRTKVDPPSPTCTCSPQPLVNNLLILFRSSLILYPCQPLTNSDINNRRPECRGWTYRRWGNPSSSPRRVALFLLDLKAIERGSLPQLRPPVRPESEAPGQINRKRKVALGAIRKASLHLPTSPPG